MIRAIIIGILPIAAMFLLISFVNLGVDWLYAERFSANSLSRFFFGIACAYGILAFLSNIEEGS